jgi:hypothetical protein
MTREKDRFVVIGVKKNIGFLVLDPFADQVDCEF